MYTNQSCGQRDRDSTIASRLGGSPICTLILTCVISLVECCHPGTFLLIRLEVFFRRSSQLRRKLRTQYSLLLNSVSSHVPSRTLATMRCGWRVERGSSGAHATNCSVTAVTSSLKEALADRTHTARLRSGRRMGVYLSRCH